MHDEYRDDCDPGPPLPSPPVPPPPRRPDGVQTCFPVYMLFEYVHMMSMCVCGCDRVMEPPLSVHGSVDRESPGLRTGCAFNSQGCPRSRKLTTRANNSNRKAECPRVGRKGVWDMHIMCIMVNYMLFCVGSNLAWPSYTTCSVLLCRRKTS